MSDFKSDYTTTKSSLCRLQKCKKKKNLETLLLVAPFLIRRHIYTGVKSIFFTLDYTEVYSKCQFI